VGERKLAGILAERIDDAVVVGVGLNVGLRGDEVPVPTATSLEIEGSSMTDRGILLRAILREFEGWYGAWRRVGGDPDTDGPGGYPPLNDPDLDPAVEPGGWRDDPADLGETGASGGLRAAYRRLCTTLGREVRVELPGHLTLTGVARDIDPAGCLVVATATGERTLSAGDVIHLRPTH
jgi:BirA family biotin operon repressor/biotin-[acetyl-CoA-carboxylase] ligase